MNETRKRTLRGVRHSAHYKWSVDQYHTTTPTACRRTSGAGAVAWSSRNRRAAAP